ncbi:MAG: carboxy terminal-processing peptidase [Gammaproteobacteria bacterium]|nr:carboxy terminal-processing peptidase [Gammaproteobacteria bacterium]
MNLFRFSLIILTSLTVSLHSYAAISTSAQLTPKAEHAKTTAEIVSRLRHQHYQRTKVFLDDGLSSTVLDRYLEDLDQDHNYFLASDIEEFEKYRFLLDDAFKTGNLNPAFVIFNRYHQRISERLSHLMATLDKGIDKLKFSENDTIQVERDTAPWAKTTDELDQLWKKRLKNDVLNLKLSGKDIEKIEELLRKRYNNQLKRIEQTNAEDAYRVYMNALTLSYDPHTQYFSPRATENFNIRMKLSLEGIGAMLQSEEDYTKVTRVIAAGPADKAGELKANDKIIGVGQGETGEIVDVIGWRLDDVVDLIRGPKDTVVRLAILQGNAANNQQSKTIAITRDTVKLEEQAASKKIIDLSSYGRKYKLGVIDIPKFYIDFDAASAGDPNYKSTTRDVKKLLQELKAEKVDGVVIDLRDNGGGSLKEVNELTGLFIKNGPTVQVRGISGRIYINEDEDNEITYSGPLAVLVNRLSASASEIFAGAIQDYRRGIVVGTQTYGKGTVQAMMPLHHGQITLTQQKFYRISGNSTQNRGVIPDISLPSLYDINEIGESALDGALPWDTIRPAKYASYPDFSQLIPRLESLHKKRIEKDPDFNYLIATNELIDQRRQLKEISLNEDIRRAEKKTLEETQLALENKRRLEKGLKPVASLDDLDKKEDKTENKNSDDEPAPLLTETAHILVDLINLNQPQFARQ